MLNMMFMHENGWHEEEQTARIIHRFVLGNTTCSATLRGSKTESAKATLFKAHVQLYCSVKSALVKKPPGCL
jgi:hypothetical protein